MTTVMIKDWGRRFRNTGYGQLSRSIAHSLERNSTIKPVFSASDVAKYSEGIPQQERLNAIPLVSDTSDDYDVMLCICPPSPLPKISKPIALYTQNALGGLIEEWQQHITVAHTVIVPGEFDQIVFKKHHPNVKVCPQMVDYDYYTPHPKYREEGPDRLSFLFVGSYSFRKGVDLVAEVFAKAHKKYRLGPCEVHLHCFTGIEGNNPSHLIDMGRRLPKDVRLTVSAGDLTLPWIRRKLNRYDIVFTLSRGEGWCMPLWEALYSGIPVVAPNSTAMGEFLPQEGVRLFNVSEKAVEDVSSSFGKSFKDRYGETSVTLFEPNVDSAAATLAYAAHNLADLKADAIQNRKALMQRFSYENMGNTLAEILKDMD